MKCRRPQRLRRHSFRRCSHRTCRLCGSGSRWSTSKGPPLSNSSGRAGRWTGTSSGRWGQRWRPDGPTCVVMGRFIATSSRRTSSRPALGRASSTSASPSLGRFELDSDRIACAGLAGVDVSGAARPFSTPTPAVDVFSWGCLCWYAAAGSSPFGGDSIEDCLATLRGWTGSSSMPAELDPMLVPLVACALVATPADWPRAVELAHVLAADGEGVSGGRGPRTLAEI